MNIMARARELKFTTITRILTTSLLSAATFASLAEAMPEAADKARATDRLSAYETDFQPIVSKDTLTKQERLQAFVKIRGQRELFVDYLKPSAGKPVVVLLNGLLPHGRVGQLCERAQRRRLGNPALRSNGPWKNNGKSWTAQRVDRSRRTS